MMMVPTIFTKDIKEYCEEVKDKIRTSVREDFINEGLAVPTLAVIQVGNNEASNRYIRNKRKDCESVGIKFEWYYYEENITQEQLINEIKDVQEFVDGIIVQLPLPKHIEAFTIKYAIDPLKDVDGFHPMSYYNPCTPRGIIEYLKVGCGHNFASKNITVIGRSEIVGKPVAKMLIDRSATVTVCNSYTRNLWDHISGADLIICAVGKPKFLNCYAIHVPVVDVGINFDENGKLVGDCYNTENREVTPVPGGVGLLTRSALLQNTIEAAYRRAGIWQV